MTLPTMLSIVPVSSTALFTGAATYITCVEHPARLSIPPRSALSYFQASFPRAAKFQASLAFLSSTTSFLRLYLNINSLPSASKHPSSSFIPSSPSLRVYYTINGVAMASIILLTILGLRKVNSKLMGTDKLRGKHALEDFEIKTLLRRWGWIHSIRTILAWIGFGSLLLAHIPHSIL